MADWSRETQGETDSDRQEQTDTGSMREGEEGGGGETEKKQRVKSSRYQ